MTRPISDFDIVDTDAGEEIRRYPPTMEVGGTGLRRNAGWITEEFLPQLRGRKGVQIYREMSDNSPTIGAFLLAVSRLIRQIEWRVEAASNRRDDRVAAQFVEQNMNDMEHSFGDLITEVMSYLTFGWSVHEIVYKRRIGPWERDLRRKSQYDDGLIGWRKMPIRGQESLLRWVFDEVGDVRAMMQMPAPSYRKIVLPLDKCLLFRIVPAKNSPEGRSLLRNSYAPWWYCKRFQEIEAIGVERDLAGMPVAYVPPEVLQPVTGSNEEKMLAAVKKMVTAVRRNEQDGIIFPLVYDRDKNLRYDFKLLTSGGSRQFDIRSIIDGYKTEMLMAVLADFMMVGHEDNGGSYALHTDKAGMFRASLNALAQGIADVFNRKAIPQLFAVNGMKPRELPKIVPNDIDPPNLTELASFMTALGGVGMQWFPDAELEKFVRDAARLPELDREIENIHEVEQRQAAILSLAEQKMQLLQIGQQAEMASQPVQPGQPGQQPGPAQQPGQPGAQQPAKAQPATPNWPYTTPPPKGQQ